MNIVLSHGTCECMHSILCENVTKNFWWLLREGIRLLGNLKCRDVELSVCRIVSPTGLLLTITIEIV
jgi:hypothetical protein